MPGRGFLSLLVVGSCAACPLFCPASMLKYSRLAHPPSPIAASSCWLAIAVPLFSSCLTVASADPAACTPQPCFRSRRRRTAGGGSRRRRGRVGAAAGTTNPLVPAAPQTTPTAGPGVEAARPMKPMKYAKAADWRALSKVRFHCPSTALPFHCPSTASLRLFIHRSSGSRFPPRSSRTSASCRSLRGPTRRGTRARQAARCGHRLSLFIHYLPMPCIVSPLPLRVYSALPFSAVPFAVFDCVFTAFQVVVFSHGLTALPTCYWAAISSFVRAGYVVSSDSGVRAALFCP